MILGIKKLTSPEAQAELEYLKTVLVGDTRTSTLLPALKTEVEWECQSSQTARWWFRGSFCKMWFMDIEIAVEKDELVCRKV